jgi:hypothetical protein
LPAGKSPWHLPDISSVLLPGLVSCEQLLTGLKTSSAATLGSTILSGIVTRNSHAARQHIGVLLGRSGYGEQRWAIL